MAELPRGTVTLLLTDVEGSTRLVKQLRDAYGDVLAAHQALLREAFDRHGGREIDSQGDAFFVAFMRTRDAVAAAVDTQRALAAHPWPEGVELRVRIGIHTAEPEVGTDRYTGLGVHRAARIMAAGHGGQILVSRSTYAVLEDDELPGLAFRDLGSHRLKDLDRPEHIYQVDVEGLSHAFPPLRAVEAPTAYTGLEEELLEAARGTVWQPRYWTRRKLAPAAAGLLLAGLATAVALIVTRSDTAQALADVDANAVGVIDPETKRITDQVPVGAAPGDVAVGGGAIWITNGDQNTVSRVDPVKRVVVQTISVGSSPSGVTIGNGAVWVANSLDGTVSRIDPETNSVVQTIPVGTFPVGIVHAVGSVWVANSGGGTITRIDADSGDTKTLPIAATELAFGAGTVWASERAANRVSRIDPVTGSVVDTITVGNGPEGLAFGSRAAWAANSLDGTVSRIDPATDSVTATILVGNGATAVAADARSVWVSNQFDGTLARIDPRTNDVERIVVGNRPRGVAIADDTVLVTVRQSGARHRGGTLRVRNTREFDAIDTAVAYDTASWPLLRMTNDGLVAFNQASGLQGTQLVANLAISLPNPTDGGRTYTFRLRPNIRFSSGRPVRASDVRATFERAFRIGKLPVPYYDGIVGAASCKKTPRSCDLSRGIVASDGSRTITFHLAQPDPEFLHKLALPFAYVLPAGTPTRQARTPLPATGPYVIARYQPKRLLRLSRNPHFREWSKAAQPDGYPDDILFEIGGTPDDAIDDVTRGKADLFTTSHSQTPPSKERLAAIKTRYASQVHTNPQAATIAIFLNTRLAPFDRVDARRALNYAADRRTAVEATGGPDAAQPTCQVLPPSFPGYRPYCPYSAGTTTPGTWSAPDLAKARALVAASGTRGMKLTFWSLSDLGAIGPYAVNLLRSLGYRVSMKVLSGEDYFVTAFNSRMKAQIGTFIWISDYPAASGFFTPLFTCASFLPASPNNRNAAAFCEPRIDRQIANATAEQVANPDAARRVWERIDSQIVDEAPLVPLVNPKAIEVLAKRVGNYQYSPQYGVLVDQLWVR